MYLLSDMSVNRIQQRSTISNVVVKPIPVIIVEKVIAGDIPEVHAMVSTRSRQGLGKELCLQRNNKRNDKFIVSR